MATDISKAKNIDELETLIENDTPEGLAERFRDYREYKMTLDIEIKGVCESFVRIGYLLKVARDTDILSESGYKNLTDFAQNEYHLTKDQVSRFIAINDRFSVGGYSEELISQYEGYGVAKLSEMLTLPDGIIEEINPDITRREIQDIKREIAAEEAVTPLEVAIEAAAPETIQEEKDYSLTERIWKEFFHENKELYKALGKDLVFMAAYTEVWTKELSEKAGKALVDILAPSGDTVLWSRVSGVGKFMISVHTDDGTIVYTNIRTNEKTKATAADAENAIHEVFGACDAHEWELVCGEEFEEPAPAPEKKPEPKPEKKNAATRQQDDSRKAAATKKYQDEIKAYKEKTGWNPDDPEWTPEKGEEYAEKEKAAREEKPDFNPEIKTVKTKPLSSIHDVETGNRLVNTETGEAVDVIALCDNYIKVATDHGGSIICNYEFEKWSIIDDDATETQSEKTEAGRQQDTAEQEDKDAPADLLANLSKKIFDKEREFEEVFLDAYTDGLTIEGLTSCAKAMQELKLLMDKMVLCKVSQDDEESEEDDDDSI